MGSKVQKFSMKYFGDNFEMLEGSADHATQVDVLPEKLAVEKIPVVFFGRLEMRKGICTFVEAIKSLEAETKKQIQIYFIGKIVEMHQTRFGDLTSDKYIKEEIQDTVDHQIFSDLYSHEAIQFIARLNHAIVCLASHQENFPNTGLEMGQLPFSLVVSDTGGFRETLALVERTSGVYWFKPAVPSSLAEMLSKAISRHPEQPTVSDHATLVQTNQKLLIQKKEFIGQAFEQQAKTVEPSFPKVTIGVTCYNLGQYLIECLTSVEAQAYRHLEVIVLDDASPDVETQEHIEHAKLLFPNYKFIRAPHNLGLGGARNYLIEMAEGDYFLPLDADNRLMSFSVKNFVEAAIANQAAIVICPMLYFGTHNGIHNFRLSSLSHLLYMNVTGDACSLFSTALLRKFKHPERRDCSTHDWCIISAAIATGETIVHYPYPLYEYRQRANSMIKNASFAKERYYLRQYLAQIPSSEWSPRQIYMLMLANQQLQSQPEIRLRKQDKLTAELQETRQRLHKVRSRLQVAEEKLEQSQSRIAAMETSKFWKFRKGWFKLKRMLGSSAEN